LNLTFSWDKVRTMKKLMLIVMLVVMKSSFAGAAEKNTYKLNCVGTEPFWSIKVDGSKVEMSSTELSGKTTYWNAQTSEAAGAPLGTAFSVKATKDKGAKRIQLSIMNPGIEGCGDGMSEEVYKYQVLAEVSGVLLYGCCN